VLAAGTARAPELPALLTSSARPAVYGMGILAAYSCFERMVVWLT
jgi:hypothetical protein